MAVVLNSEEVSYFSSTSLRRSHSQPKFITQRSPYAKRPSKTKTTTNFKVSLSPSHSASSSANSSPRTLAADSAASSYASTPASSLSFDARVKDEDDQILFPSYDDVGYYGHIEDLEPLPSPQTGNSYAISPTSTSSSTNISRPESPLPCEHAEDDTSANVQPTRHVDYLSHNWKEEDIWASWKHIVSRRGHYNNSARLENASWRTWAKVKGKLKTVSPEKLNWLKDCDVTWLYGPLQSTSERHNHMATPTAAGYNKKPILKKRSMSEVMLRKSLSSSSLLKQAAAAVQAQRSDNSTPRPSFARTTSNHLDFPLVSRRTSRDITASLSSISSSGVESPGSGERKHIHFNEQVEQCIALEMKGEDDHEPYAAMEDDDSDPDDGAIMMKGSGSKRRLPPMSHKKKNTKTNSTSDSKTIAMLPSTTLKYKADTPEPEAQAMRHSGWSGRILSPSPSQEASRSTKPCSRMLLGDEDDDDADVDWQPSNSFANRRDSVLACQDRLQLSGPSSDLTGEPYGMRRTPSGMFMPCEEDEDDIVSEGLFGKVVDTVNTAKDIAHVIWNVGWRR